jgi:hypothetical protein
LQVSEPTYPASALTLLAAMKTKRKTTGMDNRKNVFLLIISPPCFACIEKAFNPLFLKGN